MMFQPRSASTPITLLQGVDTVTATTLTADSVKVDWTYSGTSATSFKVYAVAEGDTLGNVTPIPITNPAAIEATVTGLTTGTPYTLYVQAVKSTGSLSSALLSATATTMPDAPDTLTLSHTGGDVTLGWNADINKADTFNIYAKSSTTAKGDVGLITI